MSGNGDRRPLVRTEPAARWQPPARQALRGVVIIAAMAVAFVGLPAPTSARVTSVPALLTALADNAVTDIVVANGTYRVSPASSQASNSLWIGARFASRTNPVTVRAETTGGVIFDGGAADTFGGITFVAGAHDQTWDGFVWQNGTPTGSSGPGSGTGVVVFGGYAGMAAPHHITLRNCTIRPIAGSYIGGHAVYFSWAASPGAHDIVLDGLTVDDPNGYVTAGFHFYHSDASNPNVNNVTIRNSHVIGTQQGALLWDPTLRNITFADTTITNALRLGIQYQTVGSTGIVFRNVVTVGSGQGGLGFYSDQGSNPPGVTFIGCSLH